MGDDRVVAVGNAGSDGPPIPEPAPMVIATSRFTHPRRPRFTFPTVHGAKSVRTPTTAPTKVGKPTPPALAHHRSTYTAWVHLGKRGWQRFGLTATSGHQLIWLDTHGYQHTCPCSDTRITAFWTQDRRASQEPPHPLRVPG